MDLWIWDKNKIFFFTLVTSIILYGSQVWGRNISRESWRRIKQIQKQFITHNLKIKGIIPYHILLIETNLLSIETMAMIRYLIYKNKINNMGDKRLPNIVSYFGKKTHAT